MPRSYAVHKVLKKSYFRNHLKNINILIFYLFLTAVGTGPLYALNVTLDWDGSADIDHYIIYWDTTSKASALSKDYAFKSTSVDGDSTSFTVTTQDNQTTYFAIRAFNSYGNVSEFSSEITVSSLPADSGDIGSTEPPDETGSEPPPDETGSTLPPDETDPGSSESGDDGYTPQSPDNLVASLIDNPSIEIFDKNFKHLEWLKIGWAEYISANGEARVATGDIDNDGEDEIIIGMGPVSTDPGIPGGFFQIIDHDFTHLAWGKVNWTEYNDKNGETWPTCGDIDGDGYDEIIIGLGPGGEGTLEIFKFTSGSLNHMDWVYVNWPDYNEALGETRPVCGDIDDDGIDEIIVGLGSGNENSLDNGQFEIIDNDLAHLAWGKISWPEYNELNGETWAAAGDINGDGKNEIIIGLGQGGEGKIEFFDFTGEAAEHIAWAQIDWTEYNTNYGESRPVTGDIDGDGKDEIIVGLGPVFEQSDIPQGYFQVIDDDFTKLDWGQVDWADFNEINGESRPVSGTMGGDERVIIGLGTWNVGEDTGIGTGSDNTNLPGNTGASSGGGGGGGCFLSSLY